MWKNRARLLLSWLKGLGSDGLPAIREVSGRYSGIGDHWFVGIVVGIGDNGDRVGNGLMAKIVELIFVISSRGSGEAHSPYRSIYELWTKDGGCVAEYDPCGVRYPGEGGDKDRFEPSSWALLEGL